MGVGGLGFTLTQTKYALRRLYHFSTWQNNRVWSLVCYVYVLLHRTWRQYFVSVVWSWLLWGSNYLDFEAHLTVSSCEGNRRLRATWMKFFASTNFYDIVKASDSEPISLDNLRWTSIYDKLSEVEKWPKNKFHAKITIHQSQRFTLIFLCIDSFPQWLHLITDAQTDDLNHYTNG